MDFILRRNAVSYFDDPVERGLVEEFHRLIGDEAYPVGVA